MTPQKPILLNEIWFLDIETVPIFRNPDFESHKSMWDIFTKRFEYDSGLKPFIKDQYWLDYYNNKAAMYAEFGKVICISLGKILNDKLYVKTISGTNEKKVLEEFKDAITKPGQEAKVLCAHNGKEFDFPYLFRRMVINGIEVPEPLNVAGKKPWEVPHLDTVELWGHLQWKYRCSLDLLAQVFGLPSPKADMDGSMVAEIFYSPCPADVLPFDHEEAILKRIGTYCGGDLVTLVNVFCKMKGLPVYEPEKIVFMA